MLDKVKVVHKATHVKDDDMDYILVPFTNDKGVVEYKLYTMNTKHFNTDELIMDEVQYRVPVTSKTFSADNVNVQADENGILILETTGDAVKQYRQAKEKNTDGDFMYDCLWGRHIVPDANKEDIRWGRVREGDGYLLPVYHSSTRKKSGKVVHNFYELLAIQSKTRQRIFEEDIEATTSRPPLLAESKPIRDRETGEMMTKYVNPHTMKFYNGLYGLLQDKSRRPSRYDILKDPTQIPTESMMIKLAELEMKVRFLNNTKPVSQDAIDRLDKAVKYFKAHGTVGAYYHCKLVEEIIETMIAHTKDKEKKGRNTRYFQNKIKFLIDKESTCRRDMDYGSM